MKTGVKKILIVLALIVVAIAAIVIVCNLSTHMKPLRPSQFTFHTAISKYPTLNVCTDVISCGEGNTYEGSMHRAQLGLDNESTLTFYDFDSTDDAIQYYAQLRSAIDENINISEINFEGQGYQKFSYYSADLLYYIVRVDDRVLWAYATDEDSIKVCLAVISALNL